MWWFGHERRRQPTLTYVATSVDIDPGNGAFRLSQSSRANGTGPIPGLTMAFRQTELGEGFEPSTGTGRTRGWCHAPVERRRCPAIGAGRLSRPSCKWRPPTISYCRGQWRTRQFPVLAASSMRKSFWQKALCRDQLAAIVPACGGVVPTSIGHKPGGRLRLAPSCYMKLGRRKKKRRRIIGWSGRQGTWLADARRAVRTGVN
jgi:hypothetical protein